MKKVILGIDPGYDRLGVAVIGSPPPALLYSNCLTSNAKDSFARRLATLGRALEQIIKKYRPEHIALEKLFFSKNQKTAGQVAEVRGMILYLAGQHDITVAEYAPSEIKLTITGFGTADKKQVTTMVPKLIAVATQPKYDDEYDAIAIALTHQAHSPH